MGINANLHFQLPSQRRAANFPATLGFTKRRGSWSMKGVEGVLTWDAASGCLRWDPFVRFTELSNAEVKRAVFGATKTLATKLKATGVACVPDTTEEVSPRQFIARTRLTSKRLFAEVDALEAAVPDDLRELLGFDDE